MKKILAVLSILTTHQTVAQVSLGAGAGLSSHYRLVMEAQISAEAGPVVVGVGFNAHLSSQVYHPAIFFGRIGYPTRISETITLVPGAGYAYQLHSTDRKELNKSGILLSLQLEKDLEVKFGRAFLNIMYTARVVTATIGLKAVFR